MGHIDIATRASRLFEKLVVGVYETPNKHLLFTAKERVDLATKALSDLPNVEVVSFNGLTVDFAKTISARALVRGLRISSDFEREFDMTMMNRKMSPQLEVVCLMASPVYQFLSSSLLKEAASLGGDIEDLVTKDVAEALRKKVDSNVIEITEKTIP
jgi:pantetheine-phosphate adenylyltransferase